MTKKSLWIVLSACLILSCETKKKGSFTVSGAYKNADKLSAVSGPVSKLYLLSIPFGANERPVVLDSMKMVGASGSFTLTGDTKTQGIFEVAFANTKLEVPLINDAPEIKLNVDLSKADEFYDVTGSDASNQLKDLITIFGRKNFAMDRAMSGIDSAKRNTAPDSVLHSYAAQLDKAKQDLNTYLKQVINTTNNATVAGLALSWSLSSFSEQEFKSAMDAQLAKYPDNQILSGLKDTYDQQLAQRAEDEKNQKLNNWVGKQAPDFSAPDVNGKNISLASFKGKYVLVDFWASWCGPCRMENPNVVNAYNQYKDKNFTVLGVSLDQQKDPWVQAVKTDGLSWTQISDLKQWNSAAVEVFKFNSIPFNLLIDPQGKVIGQALRGDDLESKLKEVLK